MRRSVYETKARLSEVLRHVKAGREVVITEHGRPIARIVPHESPEETMDARLDRLKARGLLVPAAESPKARLPAARRSAGALARFLDDRG